MNEYSRALLSYADSPFARQKATLLLTDAGKMSGIPALDDARERAYAEHQELDYRLVPASVLRDAADAFANQVAEFREQAKLLGAFMGQTPKNRWPAELRQADEILDQARRRLVQVPPPEPVDLYTVLATDAPPETWPDLILLAQDNPRKEPAMATAEPLTECPDCDTTGPAVYVAAEHPTSCTWMMQNIHRCHPHDELLLPSESECPTPDVDEEADNPHRRPGVA